MISLCCISNHLKPDVKFQTMTWTQWKKTQDLDTLSKRTLNNVVATKKIIEYCARNRWNYRVSSSLFPLLTHPEFDVALENYPDYDEILRQANLISAIGEKVRLSTHPDQFNVLASLNPDSVEKTIRELNWHGKMMDLFGCRKSHQNPINIHVNCSKGDPGDIAKRFMENFDRLDASVRLRLVVENEDKGVWNLANTIDHFGAQIPVTFDNLHHHCNPSDATWGDAFATWDFTRFKPLFHYSESKPSSKNPRAHADMPANKEDLNFYLSRPVDWEIELKAKDDALVEIENLMNERNH